MPYFSFFYCIPIIFDHFILTTIFFNKTRHLFFMLFQKAICFSFSVGSFIFSLQSCRLWLLLLLLQLTHRILFAFYFSLFHLLNMYGEELLCDFSILIDFSYVNNPFYKPFPTYPVFFFDCFTVLSGWR